MTGDEKKKAEPSITPPPEARQDPDDWLAIAGERLSQVRYVFMVQIEDGIASANSRAALEYSDAVLMGWPDSDSDSVRKPSPEEMTHVRHCGRAIEKHLQSFRQAEKNDQTNEMARQLVSMTDNIAQIRRAYQPDLRLPHFDEISHVVRDEWEEDMDRIGEITTASADRLRDSIQKTTQQEPEGESDEEREKESQLEAHDIPDPQGRRKNWDAFSSSH
jgi:hypothetical protein